MITMIRNSFKSKIYKIILWITILALAGIFTLPELFKAGAKASWFAKVNNEKISQSDYMRKVLLHEERVDALRKQFGPQADILLSMRGVSLNPKIFAKDAVIQDELLNQVARSLRLGMSDDYIVQALSNPLFVRQELADIIPLAAFDQMGNIDPRFLHYYFQRIGLTVSDFQEKVGEILTRHMLLNILSLSEYAPEVMVQHRYKLDNSGRKFSLLTFSFDRALQEEKKKTLSESDLNAFFSAQNEQSKTYFVPEKRSGLVWRINPQDYGIEVTDAQVEDYYENHKNSLYVAEQAQIQVRHILIKSANKADQQAAYEKAKRVRQEVLKDPKQFAIIASKESEDKSQIERGGLLPWFKRGTKEPAFDKAAFLLKENGDVSDIVTTREGFEIIQRVDKKPITYKPLSQVKKEIISALVQQVFGELFVREMRGIIEGSKSAESSLQKNMEEKGFKAQSIQNIVREDQAWGKVLFGMSAKNDADVYIEDGAGFVVQLTEIQKSYLPELETIKDVVALDLHEKRAAQAIKKTIEDAAQKAKSQTLSSLKDEFGASVSNTPFIVKSDVQTVTELKKKKIPVDQLFQLENMGSVGSFYDGRDGYVFKLDEIEPFNKDTFDKGKEEAKKGLEQEQSALFTAGFVASLYRSATIEISQPSRESEFPIAYED